MTLRHRSVFLNLGIPGNEATEDGPAALRVEIFNSLLEIGIDKDAIEGIECISKKKWYIVFFDPSERSKVIGTKITLKIMLVLHSNSRIRLNQKLIQ